MSYRRRHCLTPKKMSLATWSLGTLLSLGLVAAPAVVAAGAGPAGVASLDGWAEIDAAARAPAYPSVPLPSSVYGSAACVLLLVTLRYSRHRRWVTLR